MSIFDRALGMIAAVNHVLGAIRFYHIPANWLALAVLSGVFVDGVWRMDEMTPGALFGDGRAAAIARASLALCGLILFAICMVRRNLIFRRTSWTQDSTAGDGDREAGETVELRASGRFYRGEGLLLRDFPVSWDVSETGEISLATRVIHEPGTPDLLNMSPDRSGTWNLILPSEALTGEMEEGLLYYGLTARPALRFRVRGKPDPVVLSLGHASQLMAFRRGLDAVLAEAGRQSANFASKLEAIASAPRVEPGPAPDGRQKPPAAGKPADPGIAWNNLIDFSK